MKVAIAGKLRSGKDTVATYFIQKGLFKMYFARGIEKVIREYFPQAFEEGKPRHHYQLIGQTFRELDPDVWVKLLDRQLRDIHEFYGVTDIIVTDLRQPNEYQYLKEQGFTVIKVEANDEIRKERIVAAGDIFNEEQLNHPTELGVDNMPYDYLVTNNDTLQALFDQCEFIYNELKEESKSERSQ